MENSNLIGGWSPYRSITPQDKLVFDEALKQVLGVNYSPQMVSTQVVNGTNYRFKCSASTPPTLVVWEAIVDIYKPINGPGYVTGIIRI
jgi:hypothetical protein